MKTETLSIPTANDVQLSARLDYPDGETRAVALFAHCFSGSKDVVAVRRIGSALNALGIALLRFDFVGLGQSEGDFADTTFQSNVDDLHHAAAYLQSRNMAPTVIIGHSLGGAAVLKAALDIDSAKAVVTIGAPSEPAHVTHHFEQALDTLRDQGRAEVKLGHRTLTIGQEFVEDLHRSDILSTLGELRKALLVMHAPTDATVNIDNAAAIFAAAKHPKSFVSLDDADHLITDPDDAEYIAGVISAWVQRYLPEKDLAEKDLAEQYLPEQDQPRIA